MARFCRNLIKRMPMCTHRLARLPALVAALWGPAARSGHDGARVAHSPTVVICSLGLIACLAAVYALQVSGHAIHNRVTPAEGRHASAARYLRVMAKLRQHAQEHHLLPPGEQRGQAEELGRRWSNQLHTATEGLLDTRELEGRFDAVTEYRAALPLVTALDRDLDSLLAQAGASPDGWQLLRQRLDEVDVRVGLLALRLHVLDQDDLSLSPSALQRSFQMHYIAGAAALLAMGFMLLGARSATRRAREGQRRALAALDEARRAGEEAQQTLQARTALLGMVCHELRTPLSKALAATELIEIVARGDGVKEATSELYAAIETMAMQLNDLASYAGLMSPRSRAAAAELDIRACLHEIVRGHEAHARMNRLQLAVRVADDVPHQLHLDAVQVGQIADNLIGNAVKYAHDGVVSVGVCMHREPAARLELTVSDQGPGIAPADSLRVWEPFYRAGTAGSPGSGLGLAVVKLVVARLQGSVTLDSMPGKGCTFTVSIPV